MCGLPADVDFRFFAGLALTQVCIGLHELILNFGSEATVTVEGDLSVQVGSPERIVRDYRRAAGSVASLLSHSVTDVDSRPDGTLTLNFAGDERLSFHDSSTHYESYHIRHGSDFYVV